MSGLEKVPSPTSTHLIGARPLSVSRQKGQAYVPSTTTTLGESLQYKCVSTTTTISPLRFVTTTTMSADDFLPLRQTASTTKPFDLGHILLTGHTAIVNQGHVNMAECGSTNTVSLSSSIQSGQQVTELGETLFSNPFVSRLISFTGVANFGKVSTDNFTSMFRHGKAPPIDSLLKRIPQ